MTVFCVFVSADPYGGGPAMTLSSIHASVATATAVAAQTAADPFWGATEVCPEEAEGYYPFCRASPSGDARVLVVPREVDA